MNLENLTNTELLNKAKQFASDERNAMSDLLLYLLEIKNRKLYLESGYSSLFDYLTRSLKFSEAGARVEELKYLEFIAMNSKAIVMLRDGELSLSTACTAYDVLKETGKPELLSEFKGASKGSLK
ncbi:MAG: hypothetical protein R3A13_03780 [Bdellovibrionota bacterium]